ncbi:MAG TPA: SRPBCC family protein [Opitutaceae bacterium]
MEIFTATLLSVLGIAALLLLLAYLLPREYAVTVTTEIQQPQATVFDYLRMLRHQLQYSEWYKVDPGLRPVIRGEDGTVGAVMRWDSSNKDLGSGEQEITHLDQERINIELRFLRPLAGICQLHSHIEPLASGRTRYTCTFRACARFPVNLPAYLIGRRFIRKAQQRSVDNVREILEGRRLSGREIQPQAQRSA